MNKFSKKLIALCLAVVMVVAGSLSAFAATGSETADTAKKPIYAHGVKDTKSTKVTTYKAGNAVIMTQGVKAKDTTFVASTITRKGVTYKVKRINARAFEKAPKVTTVKYAYKGQSLTIRKNAFKNSNVKTLKLTKFKKASQLILKKGAFAKSKVKTIKVSKVMSKTQFAKLKKALKAAGFKGTVKRV